MASTGISEFTFGFAFLYEQTQRKWEDLKAVPILPNLQQEAKGGWDAHLPTHAVDYYFQFKLSDYLSGKNCKYIANGRYSTPYYRIALHKKDKNHQHRQLRRLSSTKPHTFYVAPEFNSKTDFESAYFAQSITENSRLIPLKDCKDVSDSTQHHITYQSGSRRFTVHSDPQERETSWFGRDIEGLYRGLSSEQRRVDLAFAEEIFEGVRAVAIEELAYSSDAPLRRSVERVPGRTRQSLLLAAAEVLSVYSGVTLTLVGPGEDAA